MPVHQYLAVFSNADMINTNTYTGKYDYPVSLLIMLK